MQEGIARDKARQNNCSIILWIVFGGNGEPGQRIICVNIITELTSRIIQNN
jgi:hypothetical protein